MLFKALLTVFCLSLTSLTIAQTRDNPPYKTPNTHKDPAPDPKSDKPKDKKLAYVVKPNTRTFLAGNKCFEEVTESMGFMYVAVPKGQVYYRNEFERWWHNLGAKTKVLFKNGPFWKIKVNKAYQKCKWGYGDYMG